MNLGPSPKWGKETLLTKKIQDFIFSLEKHPELEPKVK